MLVDFVREELEYLQELAEDLATRMPELRSLLGRGADPGLARLLEGSAVVLARVRERLEADAPEVAHAVADVVAPALLGPTPSRTVLELTPVGPMESARLVEPGAVYASEPIGGAPCVFRTTEACVLRPWRLVEARRGSDDERTLRLVFEAYPGARFVTDGPSPLRLYIAGELEASFGLRAFLLDAVEAVSVRAGRGKGPPSTTQIGRPVRAPRVALRPSDGARAPFDAFGRLRDVLAFPRGFAFVDVLGVDEALVAPEGSAPASAGPTSTYVVELRLARPLPRSLPFDLDHVRLHCVPAANVFRAPPVAVRARAAPDEALLPMPPGTEAYAIERVQLGRPDEPNRVTLPAFSAASTLASIEAAEGTAFERRARALSFDTRRRLAVDGARVDLAVALTSLMGASAVEPEDELHVTVLCTDAPRIGRLDAGAVARETAASPDFLEARNVVPASSPLPPALEGSRLSEILALVAASAWDVLQPAALRRVLALANDPALFGRPDAKAGSDAFEPLLDAHVARADAIDGEVVAPGLRVRLTMRARDFEGAGELRLFGEAVVELAAALLARGEWVELAVVDDTGALVFASERVPGTRLRL